MPQDGRREERGGAGGELDNEFEVPQHQVPAASVVEVAKGGDSAQTEGEISGVYMVERAGDGPKIDRGTWVDAVSEVAVQLRVCFKERAEVLAVVAVQVGGPKGECTCCQP